MYSSSLIFSSVVYNLLLRISLYFDFRYYIFSSISSIWFLTSSALLLFVFIFSFKSLRIFLKATLKSLCTRYFLTVIWLSSCWLIFPLVVAYIFSVLQILSHFLLNIRNCENLAVEVWILVFSFEDY